MRQIKELVLIQLKQFYRQPGVLFWAFIFPLAMAWILGVAFTSNAKPNVKIAWVSESIHSHSPANPDAFEKSLAQNGIHVLRVSRAEAWKLYRRQKVLLVMELTANGWRYFYDERQQESKLLHYEIERQWLRHHGKAVLSSAKSVPVQGTRYIDFLLPGLIAMGIMNSLMWGMSWTLIELRMKNLLRRMSASPMNKPGFMFSFYISRMLITAVETLILYGFGKWYFDLQLTGSLPAFILVFLTGNFAFAGIGILAASRTDNSRIGNGIINAITFPMTIVSGVFFSYTNFPDSVQKVLAYLPLTLMTDATRALFNEGAGLAQVGFPAFLLALTGALFAGIGLKVYKWH